MKIIFKTSSGKDDAYDLDSYIATAFHSGEGRGTIEDLEAMTRQHEVIIMNLISILAKKKLLNAVDIIALVGESWRSKGARLESNAE